MTTSFNSISLTDVKNLMIIENACHSPPWSEKTFSSCVGGRYFGEYAVINNNDPLASHIDFWQDMGRKNDGVFATEAFDEITNFDDLNRIETYCRLIENKDRRIMHHCLGNPDTLTISF